MWRDERHSMAHGGRKKPGTQELLPRLITPKQHKNSNISPWIRMVDQPSYFTGWTISFFNFDKSSGIGYSEEESTSMIISSGGSSSLPCRNFASPACMVDVTQLLAALPIIVSFLSMLLDFQGSSIFSRLTEMHLVFLAYVKISSWFLNGFPRREKGGH